MRTLLILLILFCTNVEAGTIYIRTGDGGDSSQCDGSVDAPRNASKKCALNNYYKSGAYSSTSTDNVVISQGSYVISVRPPDIWIPVSTFVASPLQYINAVKNGRKVFFNELGGVAYELQLRKY